MAQRVNAEFGLVDGMTADLGGPRTARLLDRLDKSVSWKELVAPIAKLPEYREKRGVGRPAWQPETMLRALLLAKWFNLSDPQLEECLKDRLSFRRFVGLSLTDATPDETTFVVFRRRLRDAGLDRTIFDATLAQLEKRGLLVKEGTLVDATIIEQSRGSHRDDGTSTRDPEASFTKKSGQTHFGFKGHIAADRSSLVTDFRFSDAAPHDSNFIDELTEDETSMVVADTAYRSEERERRLLARGVTPVIAFKRQRGEKELAKELRVFNRIVASLRAVVEHPFAWMKRTGYRRVRYRGLRRNAFDFALHLVAYNWRRSLSLARA
ncbi:MAG: IS5 family transposase [Phycisphaeraceae bacterium]|nr:IS5 family transposase [Phycisphaeraceae bacterium]